MGRARPDESKAERKKMDGFIVNLKKANRMFGMSGRNQYGSLSNECGVGSAVGAGCRRNCCVEMVCKEEGELSLFIGMISDRVLSLYLQWANGQLRFPKLIGTSL